VPPSVIAILDEAQFRDTAAASAPRPATLKVSQRIRHKKKKGSITVVAKEAEDTYVPPSLVHEDWDVDLFIPSLQEMSFSRTRFWQL
jgi:hypothetical protein